MALRLQRHDSIQINGVHPLNPLTDEIITGHLQYFAVTDDMKDGQLERAKLWPRSGLGNSGIPEAATLDDVVTVNLKRVGTWAQD